MPEKKLAKLIRMARNVRVSASDLEQQRRSFAYGNTHFENERVTRETVDRAADSLKPSGAHEQKD